MPYMMLIHEPVGQREQRGREAGEQVYQQMLDYAASLKRRGVLLAVESLAAQERGVRLQVRDGRRSLLDGPFAEAKEMVGGFFLLDCETREEAVALASECPAAQWATLELRPAAPCWDVGGGVRSD